MRSPFAIGLLALVACSQATGSGTGGGTGGDAGNGLACPVGCPPAEVCYQGVCQSVTCKSSGDCPNSEQCVNGTCEVASGCNPVCSPAQICESGRCVSPGGGSSGGSTGGSGGGSSGAASTSGATGGATGGGSSGAGGGTASGTGGGPSGTGGGSGTTGGSGGSTGSVPCSPACTGTASCSAGSCVCPRSSERYVGGACVYCDGFAADDPSGVEILVGVQLFWQALSGGGCQATLEQDGGSYAAPGGIWDVDPDDNGTTGPVYALFPGGCDDMGLGPFAGVGDGGLNYTPPAGALTVAQAIQTQGASMSVYGVVTAFYPWTSGKSGLVYLEDPVPPGGTPAPRSGLAVYVALADVPSIGTNVPARGDVVEFSALAYEPFAGRTELATSASSTMAIVGNAPLPPPVPLPASALAPSGAAQSVPSYTGMRVVARPGPFDVVDGCPLDLQYLPP